MDKDAIKPYDSLEQAQENAQSFIKNWKFLAYENQTYSAMHKPTGLHLYYDEEEGHIKSPNGEDWEKHMIFDEKMSRGTLDIYVRRLLQEFNVWVGMRAESLLKYAEQIESASKALDAFKPYIASYMANKQKS